MEPTKHKLKMTFGAAHVAYACIMHGLSDPADIWLGGQVRGKLKAAKKTPPPTDQERRGYLPNGEELLTPDYHERLESWLEKPFGELELEEDERELLKNSVQNLGKKEQLPKGAFLDSTTELIGLLGLTKKR